MTDIQKEQVRTLRSNGESYAAITRITHLSINSVKSFCQRNRAVNDVHVGTTMISESHPIEPGKCEYCGRNVNQIEGRKKKRFCSDKCRNKWWNAHLDLVDRKNAKTVVCANCKKRFPVYGNVQRKYCCHACYITDRFGGGTL